jgi:hypothetical protein
MSRDLTLYLDDILEAITLIRSFTYGMTFQEFKQDIRTQHACIRDVEVFGEARSATSRQVGFVGRLLRFSGARMERIDELESAIGEVTKVSGG